MQKKSMDWWVGIFVAMGLLAMVFLAMRVGNLASFGQEKTYQINAHFDNIGGLKVRAAVKASGVVVGRVSDINYDSRTQDAKVTLALDSRYTFTQDSSLKILTAGLLGEQYLGIETGGANTNLKNGDEIKLTSSAIVLENLIGEFLLNKPNENTTETTKDPLE